MMRGRPDRWATFLLVLPTQSEAGDTDHRVDVEIWPPTGEEPMRVAYEMPRQATVGEIGFAYFPVEVTLPDDGRRVIVVAGTPGSSRFRSSPAGADPGHSHSTHLQ